MSLKTYRAAVRIRLIWWCVPDADGLMREHAESIQDDYDEATRRGAHMRGEAHTTAAYLEERTRR